MNTNPVPLLDLNRQYTILKDEMLAALAAVWMSLGSREIDRTSQGEYYGLLLSSTLGMYFMASASNLLMAYLSLSVFQTAGSSCMPI